jgi:nucleotide-binding universal stress UspA family protein
MTGDVDRLLVSLSGDVAVDRILPFVAELVGDREIGVTLFLADDGAADDDRLDAAAGELRDAGIDVRTEVAAVGDRFDALIDAVAGHDAIVMGENAPSFRSLVFGDEAERVAAASVGPVLVVRYDETLDG